MPWIPATCETSTDKHGSDGGALVANSTFKGCVAKSFLCVRLRKGKGASRAACAQCTHPSPRRGRPSSQRSGGTSS